MWKFWVIRLPIGCYRSVVLKFWLRAVLLLTLVYWFFGNSRKIAQLWQREFWPSSWFNHASTPYQSNSLCLVTMSLENVYLHEAPVPVRYSLLVQLQKDTEIFHVQEHVHGWQCWQAFAIAWEEMYCNTCAQPLHLKRQTLRLKVLLLLQFWTPFAANEDI